MSLQDDYLHAKFGIDEIYFHPNLSADLLEKINQRAAFSLDAEDPIVLKLAEHDMVLIFQRRNLSPSLVYRFLQAVYRDKDRTDYIRANTITDQEELFSAIKSKKYALVTHKLLLKEN